MKKPTLIILICLFSKFLLSAQPRIDNFNPKSGDVGTTINITGAGFSTTPANNIVYFGAVKGTVLPSSTATSLSVVVPQGASNENISVLNGGLIGYSKVPFRVTFPTSGLVNANSFVPVASKIELPAGVIPQCVSVGDIDGDGKPDIVVANQKDNNFSVYRNTTSNKVVSYAPKINITAGSFATGVALGDLDGDGLLDVVITNAGISTVSVYRNTSTVGNISMATPISYATLNTPWSVSVADLNADGKTDIAVGNIDNVKVSVYRNTSAAPGTILFAAQKNFDLVGKQHDIVVTDLNGDGKPEVVTSHQNENKVCVLRNTSPTNDITFAPYRPYDTGSAPLGITAGDLDNDGFPEVITANTSANTVSVLRNKADGSIELDAKIDFATGATPWQVNTGDVDGDGKPEIAAACANGAVVSVFQNKTVTAGTLVFNFRTDFSVATNPQSVFISDLNEDGKPELVTGNVDNEVNNGTISILRNTVASAPPPLITGFTPVSGSTGTNVIITGTNFNTDIAKNTVYFGAVKAIVSASTASQLTVTVPNGATSVTPITVTNADTKLSVSTAQIPAPSATLKTNFTVTFPNGAIRTDTYLQVSPDIAVGTSTVPYAVVTGDFNGDGKTDFATANNSSGNVGVFLRNAGNTGFDLPAFFTTGGECNSLVAGDFNGDGKTDIAITLFGPDQVGVLLRNTANTGFDNVLTYTVAKDPWGIAAGDFNGDGKTDLATTCFGNNSVSVLIRNENNTGFDGVLNYTIGVKPKSIVAADFNGDGKIDLAALNNGTNNNDFGMSVLLRNGVNTSFDVQTQISTLAYPYKVITADFNEDGKADLAVSYFGLTSVSVFLRNTANNGFESIRNFSTQNDSRGIITGDFNGDGKADLAVTNVASKSLSILVRNPANTSSLFDNAVHFKLAADTRPNYNPSDVATGDFNGDGKADLVTSNQEDNSATVLLYSLTTLDQKTLPTILTANGTTINATNASVTLSQTLTGTKVELVSKGISRTGWQRQDVTGTNNVFSAALPVNTTPPNGADEIGLTYYFDITLPGGSKLSSDTIYAHINTNGLPIPGLKFGTQQSDYQIFSVPLQLANKNVNSVLEELGTYDDTQWRMFRYKDGAYQEFRTNGFATIESGEAYLLIVRNTASINTGAGSTLPVKQSQPAEIALKKGFNLIGNPYNLKIAWTDLKSRYPGLGNLRTLQNGTFQDTDVLDKFGGGFVNVDNDLTIKIPVLRNATLNGQKTAGTEDKDLIFEVNFKLKAGITGNDLGSLGMHKKALTGKDNFDDVPVPRFQQFIDLNFAHPDYFLSKFTRDMVPESESYSWEFTVESNVTGENAVMTWEKYFKEKTDKKLVLQDLDNLRLIDMTLQESYTFPATAQKKFRVYYGSQAFLSEKTLPQYPVLQQNFPNPVTESTILPFILPDKSGKYEVEMEIFNATGQHIRTLVKSNYKAGFWQTSWDGKDGSGKFAEPGLYCCRMSIRNGDSKQILSIKIIKL